MSKLEKEVLVYYYHGLDKIDKTFLSSPVVYSFISDQHNTNKTYSDLEQVRFFSIKFKKGNNKNSRTHNKFLVIKMRVRVSRDDGSHGRVEREKYDIIIFYCFRVDESQMNFVLIILYF